VLLLVFDESGRLAGAQMVHEQCVVTTCD